MNPMTHLSHPRYYSKLNKWSKHFKNRLTLGELNKNWTRTNPKNVIGAYIQSKIQVAELSDLCLHILDNLLDRLMVMPDKNLAGLSIHMQLHMLRGKVTNLHYHYVSSYSWIMEQIIVWLPLTSSVVSCSTSRSGNAWTKLVAKDITVSVSYTHLTLPTNREE